VFDKYDTERLAEWKQFRDRLEVSDTPLEDVANLWSLAPFVNPYLNPNNPSEWPDPWHLVLDSRLDDLAITLGMLYTIKLTQRFIKTKCEIHKLMIPGKSEVEYVLIVDDSHVLNHACRTVSDIEEIKHLDASIVWQQ
jgi:hypothetical protein